MKKLLKALTFSALTILTSQQLHANELNWEKQTKKFLKEFNKGDYSNISLFHGIVMICESLPESSAELELWIMDNFPVNSEEAEVFEDNIRSCDKLEKKGYKNLNEIYEKAAKNGSVETILILASNIPYNSKEKLKLLSSIASQSIEATNLIGFAALDGESWLSNIEQFFWLSVSDFKTDLNDQPEPKLSFLEGEITADNLSLLYDLIELWNDGLPEEKSQVLTDLHSLNQAI
ncbi:hypothetical protein Q4602_21550 [Paraglaciecola chathamensis]|uniref:hypothetical protein n=1 Tax=Paraglaciecola chathamensis TaxID=368405 RepID=UPI00270832D3|nr:hypothetical protein [Paraglaciecola chathamensis]MDO6842071.1 hypothetical protein [Paraglaciecola chathamensis]